MSKILILGGTGFIGFNLSKSLSKDPSNRVTLADNLSRGQRDKDVLDLISAENVNLIEADFTNPAAFDNLEIDYDQVYMLASVVGVNNTLQRPHDIIRINSLLILNTLEWLAKSNVKKVLFTSTSENYAGTIDEFNYTIPTPEEVPLCISDIAHPRYTYAVTKMLGESAFLNYARVYGFECCVVRYHNVFGPRMGFKHVIPHLVERFRANENPFLVYGADQTRAFCYIDDAVEGTILAMTNESSNGEIFHIGTSEEVSIRELIRESGNHMEFSGEYEDAPTYPGSTQRRCPDITKAKTMLGYEPKVDWKDGLKTTLNWYNEYFAQNQETFESSFEKPAL